MGNYWAARSADEWTIRDVRWHWGSAYKVFRSLGSCRATRRDETGKTLIARDPGELVGKIRADYRGNPVPR
jgi:hypothetical protein